MKRSRRDAGVSLIEALVALAIMSFGMLGVIGMQATLRFNAEAAKQRSEAVRLAQEEVERWRSFSVLDNSPPQLAFQDIASSAVAAAVALPGGSNTDFTRTTTVAAPVAGDPPLALVKTVTVTVNWRDRRNELQAVTLTTRIAGIAPELAGSLGIPGDQAATQRPRERHPAIPVGAVNQGNGESRFTPPGAGAPVWVFNNATGQITSTCNGGCLPFDALLLSGFVQFAAVAPPPALGLPAETDAETPTGPAIAGVGVRVLPSAVSPTFIGHIDCHVSPSLTFVAYFCAVPTIGGAWSGQSIVTGALIPLAATLGNSSVALYKVCRYTSAARHLPPVANSEHPLDYVDVATSLTNQNFLVTQSGDGTTAYPCPGDGPSPLVNSLTFAHQPIAP